MSTKIDFIDYMRVPNATTSGASVVSRILVGANANFFLGEYGSWSGYGSPITYSTSSTEISTVGISGSFFLADGQAHTSGTLLQINAITGSVSRTATGSSGQPPAQARLAATYRNRLVLGRTEADPHNLFFSEVDNHTTFDYSNVTSIGAFAMNEPNMPGRIGDVITGFYAINKDYAIIACEDSMWQMRGDPRAGGSVDNVAWGGGMVGQFAGARDQDGTFYYLTHTDLMMMKEGTRPKSISEGRIQRFLSRVDFAAVTVRLVWEQKTRSLWIFFCPATASATTALKWDSRLDAFEKHQFPSVFGPTAARSLVGDIYQDQQVLLGSHDGLLWTFDNAWTSDNSTAINSFVRLTPMALAEAGQRGLVKEMEFVSGLNDYSKYTVNLYVGDDAQAAATGTSSSFTSSTTDTGRYMQRMRVRGNSANIRISNSDAGRTWAIEQSHLVFGPNAGRTR